MVKGVVGGLGALLHERCGSAEKRGWGCLASHAWPGPDCDLPRETPPPSPVILFSRADPPARILASRRSLRSLAWSAALDGGVGGSDDMVVGVSAMARAERWIGWESTADSGQRTAHRAARDGFLVDIQVEGRLKVGISLAGAGRMRLSRKEIKVVYMLICGHLVGAIGKLGAPIYY